MKMKLKTPIIILSLITFTALAAAQCFPQYECGSWDVCTAGFQTRICKDMQCNNKDIIERTTCANVEKYTQDAERTIWTYVEEFPDSECSPKIQCRPWG